MAGMSRRLVSFLAASAVFIPFPGIAGEIEVPLDNVITLTLDRPASSVYLANPAIADITKIDARHFFILGKSFGTTNILTVDSSGRQTMNAQLVVTERVGRPVTIQRGNAHSNMICTPVDCEAAPAPGDGGSNAPSSPDQAPAAACEAADEFEGVVAGLPSMPPRTRCSRPTAKPA